MIKVTFTENPEKLSLRLEGHAEYAEHGKDIVCASASILAYTVAQYVKLANDNGELKTPPEIVLNGGDAFVSCEYSQEAKKIFDFAELGYQLLKYNYPKYVSLNDLT